MQGSLTFKSEQLCSAKKSPKSHQKKIFSLNLHIENPFINPYKTHDNETRHDCHFGFGKPRKHRTCQSHPRLRRL